MPRQRDLVGKAAALGLVLVAPIILWSSTVFSFKCCSSNPPPAFQALIASSTKSSTLSSSPNSFSYSFLDDDHAVQPFHHHHHHHRNSHHLDMYCSQGHYKGHQHHRHCCHYRPFAVGRTRRRISCQQQPQQGLTLTVMAAGARKGLGWGDDEVIPTSSMPDIQDMRLPSSSFPAGDGVPLSEDEVEERILAVGSLGNKTLDEQLDEIDDIYMGRTPSMGRGKVKVWGAWLDADVAGRKAGKGNRAPRLKAKAAAGGILTNSEKAEVFYEEGVAAMNQGRYDTCRALLDKAIEYADPDTRRGGEFTLWLAQAYQGVGRDEEALNVLRGLETHGDRDVSHVSKQMRFILEAPRQALTKGVDYVDFPLPNPDTYFDGYDKDNYKSILKGKTKVPYTTTYRKSKKEREMEEIASTIEIPPGLLWAMSVVVVLGLMADVVVLQGRS